VGSSSAASTWNATAWIITAVVVASSSVIRPTLTVAAIWRVPTTTTLDDELWPVTRVKPKSNAWSALNATIVRRLWLTAYVRITT
jgi:hypothetical protein